MIGKLYELHPECESGLWGGRLDKKPKWIQSRHILLCVDKKLVTDRFIATNGMYFLFYNSYDGQIYMFPEEMLHEYLVQV